MPTAGRCSPLQVDRAGDFSDYTLTITGAPLDLMFNSTTFSFKVLCPSDFDCAPAPLYCPPDDTPLPPIDYLAKDFLSFKQALTDFSALRYPAWQERAEADFGMMFLEALSAIADELSYLQDRVAAEATLQTATQRRSLVSLARLVDYEPVPALSATTIIQCNVQHGPVAAGLVISAAAPDGSAGAVRDRYRPRRHQQLRRLPGLERRQDPTLLVRRHPALPATRRDLDVDPGPGLQLQLGADLALLIQTDLPGESIREIVHLLAATGISSIRSSCEAGQPTPVTLITWGAADALQRDHDLTITHLAGNLLPATQGRRISETFAIVSPPASASAAAVGHRATRSERHRCPAQLDLPLPAGPGAPGLAAPGRDHGRSEPERAVPEISLTSRSQPSDPGFSPPAARATALDRLHHRP